jgi:hypothetical protein
MHHQSARIIPRLEDKYEISAGLDELVATETHSEASYARYLLFEKSYILMSHRIRHRDLK